ncbi:vacuolar-type H+-ATPase subunit H [Pseudomonas sp. TE3786]
MKRLPIAAFTLLGLTLAGCDAAEESAQKLTDKAGQVAQELARETLSDTVNSLNEQIDKAQKSTQELLGKPLDKTEGEQPKGDSEVPAGEVSQGIET